MHSLKAPALHSAGEAGVSACPSGNTAKRTNGVTPRSMDAGLTKTNSDVAQYGLGTSVQLHKPPAKSSADDPPQQDNGTCNALEANRSASLV